MKKKSTQQFQKGRIGQIVGLVCEKYKLDQREVRDFLLKSCPELKEKSRCANCNASMAIYEHRIDTLDALLLFGMGKIVGNKLKDGMNFTEANKVHLQASLNSYYSVPSRSTWCSKLGLITHATRKTKDGRRTRDQKAGWCITDRGFAFLAGKPVPAKVQTFRNRITERFTETTTIQQVVQSSDKHSPEGRELSQHADYPFDKLEHYSVAGFKQGQLL